MVHQKFCSLRTSSIKRVYSRTPFLKTTILLQCVAGVTDGDFPYLLLHLKKSDGFSFNSGWFPSNWRRGLAANRELLFNTFSQITESDLFHLFLWIPKSSNFLRIFIFIGRSYSHCPTSVTFCKQWLKWHRRLRNSFFCGKLFWQTNARAHCLVIIFVCQWIELLVCSPFIA